MIPTRWKRWGDGHEVARVILEWNVHDQSYGAIVVHEADCQGCLEEADAD